MADILDMNKDEDDLKVIENDDGSADVLDAQDEEEAKTDQDDSEFYTENLVEMLDEVRKEEIVLDYIRLIEKDKKARQKHDEQCKKALESTGLSGDAVPAFEGGSTLVHPILAKTSVDFASHAIKEIFPAEGPVRTSILGKTTRKKLEKAERKRRHMNWQLTREISEYRNNLEQMLPMVALCGSQYIRMYWWEKGKRPRSEFISSDKIYLPYTVGSFYSTQRLTYEETISDMEYDMRVMSGMYDGITDEIEVEGENGDIGGVPDMGDTSMTERQMRKIEGKNPEDEDGEETRIVYNVYCYMKLPEDKRVKKDVGYAPYIMSINKATEQMVALYRNWEFDDTTYQAMDWIIEWPMIPWGHSVYTIGAGHLVGQLARGASGALRCLLDSGLASTAPTALKTKSMGLSGQSKPIKIGSINEINSNAGLDDIRKSITPLPFNPPSNVLFELLGFLVESASDIARSTVDSIADQTSNTPVGTQLSRIEQGMVVFSAIHARLHDAQRRTLEVLHRINRMYLPDGEPEPNEQKAAAEENEPLAYRSDYLGEMDICPVSDPNIFSEQQRFSQNQAIYQLAKENPGLYDMKAVNKRLLGAMKIQGIEEIMPDPTAPHDENPAAENIKMAMGQPSIPLPTQDHLAHLQVHLDFLQSPTYGQNPAILPTMSGPMLEHLKQHLVFNYGEMMQERLKEAVSPDFTGDMNELIGEDGATMNELSKAIAALSPIVTEQSGKLFEKAIPVIQQLQKFVDSNKPPPPMDPAQAMIKAEEMRGQTKEKEIQAKVGIEQQKEASKKSALDQKGTTEQQKLAQKASTEEEKLAHQEMSDHIDASLKEDQIEADLLKNQEDNRTALDIAGMRVETGKRPGNLKDGSSLSNNP